MTRAELADALAQASRQYHEELLDQQRLTGPHKASCPVLHDPDPEAIEACDCPEGA